MKEFGSTGQSTGFYLWCDDSAFDYIDKYEDGPKKGRPLPADGKPLVPGLDIILT